MNGYSLRMAADRSGIADGQTLGNFRLSAFVKAGKTDRTDNQLIERANVGELNSFRELVERYNKQAYHYACAMIRNSDDAYDLSQEAFIRVYKHLKRYDPTFPFKVWLFHILANLCKNYIRQKKTRDRIIVNSDNAESVDISNSDSPDMPLYQSEIKAQIWNAISKLPEKFREIIVLSHFQDLSYDQIAKVLEIPRGSVMSRLYYARLKLREILEKEGVEL